MKQLVLALCSLVLLAGNVPPPLPAPLAPYVVEHRFIPGDYGWFKGRFLDATEEDRSAFQQIQSWALACRAQAIEDLRLELIKLGYDHASLDNLIVGPLVCRLALFQPQLADYSSFERFREEVAIAGPVADAFIAGVERSYDIVKPRDGAFAKTAIARRITDQATRSPQLFGRSSNLNLTAAGLAIFQSRLILAMAVYDYENTEWLKSFVAENGWPTISQVGDEASSVAWLLVQHADHDPLFQLEALGLIEPLAERGEVSKQNYAYLYDRVMLKLVGKQRYGTQVSCVDGQRLPLPLEDMDNLEMRRETMGLGTETEYIQAMDTGVGPCPVARSF